MRARLDACGGLDGADSSLAALNRASKKKAGSSSKANGDESKSKKRSALPPAPPLKLFSHIMPVSVAAKSKETIESDEDAD